MISKIIRNKVFAAFACVGAALPLFCIGGSVLPSYDGDPPANSAELNDIPGDLPMGEWIEYISSNVTAGAVILTNGVLTVGTNTIKISPAQHMVVTTNSTVEPPEISTNFFDAVFQDEMTNAIAQATNDLNNITRVVVTTNYLPEGGYTITTNLVQTRLAYMEDVVTKPIDPDSRKADKVIEIWDFDSAELGMPPFRMSYTIGEQPSVMTWTNSSSYVLGFNPTNSSPWFLDTGETTSFSKGTLSDTTVKFILSNGDEITFTATPRKKVAWVVYNDYLYTNFVDKASMGQIAGTIVDTNLVTLNGVKLTLQNMRSALYDIAGSYSTRVKLRNIARNNVVRLGNATMVTDGDLVDIDWGDGSIYSATNFPVEHTYPSNMTGSVIIDIKGQLKSIEGSDNPILPWITFKEADDGRRAGWESIGERFEGISFGHSVGLTSLGEYAFANVTGLASLEFLPSTVKDLQRGCFQGCTSLSSLAGLPLGIRVLPDYCFQGSGLNTLVDMPSSITELGEACFESTSLTSLAGLSCNITAMGPRCFRDTKLESLDGFNHLSNIEDIPIYCFAGTSIKAIKAEDFGSSIALIGVGAFETNRFLTSIELPANQSLYVGINAFAGNTCVTSITVYSGTVLDENAFLDCGNDVTEVGMSLDFKFIGKTIAQVKEMQNFQWGLRDRSEEIKFLCKDGWLNPTTDGGYATNYTTIAMQLNDVTQGETFWLGAMDTVSGEVTVEWGDGKSESGTGPFRHQYDFSSDTTATADFTIRVYGKVKSISAYNGKSFLVSGNGADTENIFLTSFEVGNAVGLESIGKNAFNNCPNLTTVSSYADAAPANPVLPSPLASIGDTAFANCTSLRNLGWLPESLSSLGNQCFINCTGLTDIHQVSNTAITAVPYACFSNCSSIASLPSFQSKVVEIGDYAFASCAELKSLEGLPESVSLGEGAFMFDYGLKNLEGFPSGLTSIPANCFNSCTNLMSLEGINDKIAFIGEGAFANTYNVTNALFVSTVEGGFSKDCFSGMGRDFPGEQTDIYGKYNSIIQLSNIACQDAIIKGIEDAGVPATTRINCTDGTLVGVAESGGTRWIVYQKALDITIEIDDTLLHKEFAFNQNIKRKGPISIYWGDNRGAESVSANISQNQNLENVARHSYTNSGTYTISVSGDVESIAGSELPARPFFFSPTDRTPVTKVLLYFREHATNGTQVIDGISSLGNYCFYGCSNLNSLAGLSIQNTTRDYRKVAQINRLRSYGIRASDTTYRSSITSIGRHCFDGCTRLTDLKGLPPVVSLPDDCFLGCSSLSTLDGLSSNTGTIGERCFKGCSALSDLSALQATTIPYVPYSCFEDCTNISGLVQTLPSVTTNIGERAFANCVLVKSLLGMDSAVNTLGTGAFRHTGLTNLVDISPSIKAIPNEGFQDCFELTTINGIPTNIFDIGQFAFANNTNLNEINDFPLYTTNVQRYAFAQCTSLTRGTMHHHVKRIGDNFMLNSGSLMPYTTDEAGITSYTRIDAPNIKCSSMVGMLNSSSNINPFLEFACYDGYVVCITNTWVPLFKSVVVELTNVVRGTSFSISGIKARGTTPLKVDWGDGSGENYVDGIRHTYQKNGTFVIDIIGFIESISASSNRYPFITSTGAGNPYISRIGVGEATKCSALGDYCFKGCTNLRSLSGIKGNRLGGLDLSPLVSFGKECFAGCTSLRNLVGFPKSITAMGDGCFSNCTSLASVWGISKFVTDIPAYCFADCPSISGLSPPTDPANSYLPSSIKALRTGCFKNCSGIPTLQGMPSADDLTVENEVFFGCSGITNLVGYTAGYLTTNLFGNCFGLLSLQGIPSGITTIPDLCFSGCYRLKSLSEVPSTVTAIGDYAFRSCSSLTNLTGLWNVSSIGSFAFDRCTRLQTLSGLSTNLTSIASYAFYSNINLVGFGPSTPAGTIASPSAAFSIGDHAFDYCSKFGSNSPSFLGLPTNIVSFGISSFAHTDMRAVTNLPSRITYLPDEVFDSTYLTNITIDTEIVSTISSNAFSNETCPIFTYGGLPTTRFVHMPSLTTDGIRSLPNFPFGCSIYTRFIGYDGSLVYHNSQWVTLVNSMSIDLTVTNQNNSVTIRGLYPQDTHGYSIDWGDGSYSNWLRGSATTSHTYSSTTNYTITIVRPIDYVNTATSVYPFLRTSGTSATAIYMSRDVGLQSFNRVAFRNLSGLTQLPVLPESTGTLGEFCFYECSSIPEVTTLPSSISNFGQSAFALCTSVTNVSLDLPLLDRLPDWSFQGCSSLSRFDFSMSTNFTSLGTGSLSRCTSLQGIDLTPLFNLQKLETSTFAYCSNLANVVLSPSLFAIDCIEPHVFKDIGWLAEEQEEDLIYEGYKYRSSITMLYQPCDTITNMVNFPWGAPHHTRFAGADGDVVWNSNKEEWVIVRADFNIYATIPDADLNKPFQITLQGNAGDTNFINWAETGNYHISTNIFTTSATKTAYHTYTKGGDYIISVRGPVRGVQGSSSGSNKAPFMHCGEIKGSYPYLKGITITERTGFTNIGNYAFANCSDLLGLDWILSPYVNIGQYALYGCTSLNNVLFPNSLDTIGAHAFDGCTNLIYVTLPNNDTLTMGDYVFRRCLNLGQIEVTSTNWPTMTEATLRDGLQSGETLKFAWKIKATGVLAEKIEPTYAESDYYAGSLFGLNTNGFINVFDGRILYTDKGTAESPKWWIFRNSMDILVENVNDVVLTLAEPDWYELYQSTNNTVYWEEPFETPRRRSGKRDKIDSISSPSDDGEITSWSIMAPVYEWTEGSWHYEPCDPFYSEVDGRWHDELLVVDDPPSRRLKGYEPMETHYEYKQKVDLSFAAGLRQIVGGISAYSYGSWLRDTYGENSPEYQHYLKEQSMQRMTFAVPKKKSITQLVAEKDTQTGKTNYVATVVPDKNPWAMPETQTAIPKATYDTAPIIVDWGDGTRSTLSFWGYDGSHEYIGNHGKVRIRIIGQINSLNGRGDGLPFLSKADRNNVGKRVPADVTSVKVNDGMYIKSIGQYCFANYVKLTNCVLPATIINMAPDTFRGAGVKNLSCLPRYPSIFSSIPERCFYGCTNLTDLQGMPSRIRVINASAFENAANLTSLNGMSANVDDIRRRAFANTGVQNLSGLSSRVSEIPQECFRGSDLASLSGLPTSVKKLGASSFAQTKLKNLSGLTSSITNIGDYFITGNSAPFDKSYYPIGAFHDLPELTSIDALPTTVHDIPADSFSNCPKIASPLTVKQHISAIASSAFNGVRRFILPDRGAENTHPIFYKAAGKITPGWGDYLREIYMTNAIATIQYEAFPNATNVGVRPMMHLRMNGISAGDKITLGSMVKYEDAEPLIIQWGDGSKTVSTSKLPDSTSHTYSSGGNYTISMCGFIQELNGNPNFALNSTGTNDKLTQMVVSDVVGLKKISPTALYGMQNLQTVQVSNTVNKAELDAANNQWQLRTGTLVYSHYAGVLTAFIKPECIIIFDANGGKGGKSITVPYNNPIGKLPKVTRKGYELVGWFDADTGGNQISAQTIAMGDATYYAHWQKTGEEPVYDDKMVPVIFDGNGNGYLQTRYVKLGTAVGSLPSLSGWTTDQFLGFKRNYIQYGWWTSSVDGQGERISSSYKITNANGERFYAQWREHLQAPFSLPPTTTVTGIDGLRTKVKWDWDYENTGKIYVYTDQGVFNPYIPFRSRAAKQQMTYLYNNDTGDIIVAPPGESFSLYSGKDGRASASSTNGVTSYRFARVSVPTEQAIGFMRSRSKKTVSLLEEPKSPMKRSLRTMEEDLIIPSEEEPAVGGFLSMEAGSYRGMNPLQFTDMYYMPTGTKVEDYIFYNNTSMTEMPLIPTNVVEIGAHAYENTKIGEFGDFAENITTFGDRSLASLQQQAYSATINASNLTMGVEVFGEIYPFGVSKKEIDFPNISAEDLKSTANFPFAKLYDDAMGKRVEVGYTNEFVVFRCKDSMAIHPVVTSTNALGKVTWDWR